MPEYVYLCPDCRTLRLTFHPIHACDWIIVTCPQCGAPAGRRPKIPQVNWGGLRPSQGEIHPNIQKWLDSAPERRAKFEQDHEIHERMTAHEYDTEEI